MCCKLCNTFMAELWWEVQGITLLKNFYLFTFGKRMNSLKQKKPSKLIYFECKFNANML